MAWSRYAGDAHRSEGVETCVPLVAPSECPPTDLALGARVQKGALRQQPGSAEHHLSRNRRVCLTAPDNKRIELTRPNRDGAYQPHRD